MGIGCGWLFLRQKLPSAWVPILAIVVLALAGSFVDLDRWFLWGGIGASLCLLFLKYKGHFKNSPVVFVLLGDSSYALYLLHLPVVTLCARLPCDLIASRWTILVASALLSQLLAILVWKLFDRPVQSWIGRWLAKMA